MKGEGGSAAMLGAVALGASGQTPHWKAISCSMANPPRSTPCQRAHSPYVDSKMGSTSTEMSTTTMMRRMMSSATRRERHAI